MNIIPIAKTIVSSAASLGVGTVLSNAITATSPAELTKYKKVAIGIGGVALSALVNEAVTRQTEKKFDEAAAHFGFPKDVDLKVDVETN